MTIEKLDATTPNLTLQNIARIAELFPECVTEGPTGTASDTGAPVVDFDLLRQSLANHFVDGPYERYRLDWPGKRKAMLTANTPVAKTLRPMREESVDFDNTRNLFIEGDNLDALKLLQETYLGKVKMIYLDPPYNTGKDFIYKDNFAQSREEYEADSGQRDAVGGRLVSNPESNGRFHSDWLSMMYSRLRLARNLLREDGVALVSIDESERLMDEIFGEKNFAGEIVWKNSSKNDQDFIAINHEFIIIYAKDKMSNGGDWRERKPGLDQIYSIFEKFKREMGEDWKAIHAAALEWYRSFPPSDPIFDSSHYNWMDRNGVYFASDLSGPNDGQYIFDLPHEVTGLPCKMPASGWRYPEVELLQRAKDGRVHFGEDHTKVPQNKTYLRDVEYQSLTSVRYLDGRGASNRLKALFGQKVFTNPKDEFLIADIARAVGISSGDIIMDLFAGSGTVAQSVMLLQSEHKINCNFVLIQIAESLANILATAQGSARQTVRNAMAYLEGRGRPSNVSALCQERIRLSGELISMAPDRLAPADVGFRAFRVDSANFHDTTSTPGEMTQGMLAGMINHIKADRSDEDLLFGALLRWGVDITLPVARRELLGHTIWLVDPPPTGEANAALIACFARPADDRGGIEVELADALAALKPLRILFRDDGFANDAVKENVASRIRQRAPDTALRVL